MDIKNIGFGKVLLKVLDLIIVMPFTLPLKIYYNSLKALSDSSGACTEESELSPDFPLYGMCASLMHLSLWCIPRDF